MLFVLALSVICLSYVGGDFTGHVLRAHNYVRSLHQHTHDVIWNDDLAAGAQSWADHLAAIGPLVHDESGSFGENLYFGGVDPDNYEMPVHTWYEQNLVYDWNSPGYQSEAAYFTQVIWSGTNEIGCGSAPYAGYQTYGYVVCRYTPAGNQDTAAAFTANVHPLKAGVTADFTRFILDAHNSVRNLHQDTNGVTWNSDIAAGAQAWADHLAHNNLFEHDQSSYGENLFKTIGSYPPAPNDGRMSLFSWYKEVSDYNWNQPGESLSTSPIGHFTQVVWVATTEIGCGRAVVTQSPYYTKYVVCRYQPKGNYYTIQHGQSAAVAKAEAYEANVKPFNAGAQY